MPRRQRLLRCFKAARCRERSFCRTRFPCSFTRFRRESSSTEPRSGRFTRVGPRRLTESRVNPGGAAPFFGGEPAHRDLDPTGAYMADLNFTYVASPDAAAAPWFLVQAVRHGRVHGAIAVWTVRLSQVAAALGTGVRPCCTRSRTRTARAGSDSWSCRTTWPPTLPSVRTESSACVCHVDRVGPGSGGCMQLLMIGGRWGACA